MSAMVVGDASAAAAPTARAAAQPGDCTGLTGGFSDVPGAPTRVTAAEVRPGRDGADPSSRSWRRLYANDKDVALPAHCSLRGTTAPQIQFELRLPMGEAWNSDYFQVFCTGACGVQLTESCFPALERSFAVATNDGGH